MTESNQGTPASLRTVLPDADAMARHAADLLVERMGASTGRFSIALSGGSTPRRLYELLSGEGYRERIDWGRLWLFWGDERMVPPDDADSNLRMVREALLERAPVPPAQVFPMPQPAAGAADGFDAMAAARLYDGQLRAFYGRQNLDASRPLFDLTLLGLGDNGHTASLFPGDPSLGQSLAWVWPCTTGVPQPRLTLTYPALASSALVLFLVSGAGKRAALRKVWAGDRSQPATQVRAIGELRWIVDEAAA